MQIGRIDLNKLRGIGDKFVGLNKEFIGTISGNDRLVQEGEAQQARATEELKALRREAEAEGHEAKAEALEQRQKAAQRAKESA
jgi:F0F1-type ATP synthase membrane subunit b/b'